MNARERHVNVIGAGPAGTLTALLLARRGMTVDVYERREDPRHAAAERGRSINLALAARGIRALELAGLMPAVAPRLVPMRGRRVHERDGSTVLLAYGQNEGEVIHSISRATLTRTLIAAAACEPNIALRFRQTCLAAHPATAAAAGRLELRDEPSGRTYEVGLAPTIAADGAGSAVRASLAATGCMRVQEAMLDHDYKELTIPAQAGGYVLEREALHLWPRGGFMLIALPNADGSFTATLFLARDGDPGFSSLRDDASVRAFFAAEFPDVLPLMPNLSEDFRLHPQGRLGTVHADPWQIGGELLLLGDAAHAIVPFHGQGMNCAFEDCTVLDALLAPSADWNAAFAAFAHDRRPNTDAIATMALENYLEMRDSVRDPSFVRHQALAQELERRFPERFIPRYSMVMFRPEIPYAEAQRRGAIQQAILKELDACGGGADRAAGALPRDEARLRALIESRLTPLG